MCQKQVCLTNATASYSYSKWVEYKEIRHLPIQLVSWLIYLVSVFNLYIYVMCCAALCMNVMNECTTELRNHWVQRRTRILFIYLKFRCGGRFRSAMTESVKLMAMLVIIAKIFSMWKRKKVSSLHRLKTFHHYLKACKSLSSNLLFQLNGNHIAFCTFF